MMILAALKEVLGIYKDAVAVGWLVTAYLLVAAASTAIASRLGDLFGHRRVLCWVLIITAVGSAISLFSRDLSWIIFGRAVQGVSGALLPLGMGLVRRHVPAHRVSLSVGILLSASGIAATVGLLVGGILTDTWGWHYIFAASGGFALLSWLAVVLTAPKPDEKPAKRRIDVVGGLLFVPGIGAIIYAIGESRAEPFPGATAACLAVGVALLAVWYRHELRHPDPLIDVRLLTSRWGAWLNICTALWAMGILQLTQTQMIFLQQPLSTGAGLGLTATAAAMVKMPAKAITMFIAPIAGQLCEVFGPRRIVFTGFCLAAIGWVLLIFSHDNIWIVGTIMALFCAMGVTVVYTGVTTAAVMDAPPERTSEAVGVMMVTRTIAQAVGAQTVMTMLDGGGASGYPQAGDYLLVFSLIAAMAGVGALAATRLPARREA